ncbi:MAG: hypothetical protein WA960_09175 [Tunicatimonas sp.]
MYRIINSLATAEFNKATATVEVNFNGHGDPVLYHDTMDIAMSIAVMYNTNRWLFTKDLFHDVDVDHFLLFVRKWSSKNHEIFEASADHPPCRVALLTTADSYEHLAEKHQWLNATHNKFNQLLLRVFFDRTEAENYLTSPSKQKSEPTRNLYASNAL